MAGRSAKPWYHEGLRFECSGCGDCCSGEPGFVWVEPEEIAAMAEKMEMPVPEFEDKFVREESEGKSLIEYPDGDCIFLEPETRKCIVYEARPVQCRTWPFWNSNLTSKRAWKETCDVCPGSGVGKLYSLEQIEARRKEKDV
ncbi:YkgJ family cysteine cluster protein [Roseimaritima ulvae]|uniref:Flagellin N-methylase n=1 Tax=Roseimaritima ulvae TaxID=980254 RepID=A0A5B9QQ92_9BACT|nr:YkgJ family cysteine cluster protein [Roseimaritima ulvae]QEG39685.1 Flagellin N-methylase [Roseimaritima ulvae]